ncbi:FeoB-associated Cys-rich membrane protein [Sporofaciens musculi]|jgi:hypothetical protein|uniref:FeoB-associated Cys-rich membrane protein n=1 Tax=Sporofaciens musculi TaxID=2681861 RepID=UPI002173AF83|nr:FeoB-associated Cys-rich membrane protein [Sporofaciens musculi]MCI9423482.1 FeoB-associated Cys-rich membrane protein [Dorea sp.]
MALAAGNIFSTSIVGIGVLCIVILAVRNIWKKRKEGGCSGCGCSGCGRGCPSKNMDTDRRY